MMSANSSDPSLAVSHIPSPMSAMFPPEVDPTTAAVAAAALSIQMPMDALSGSGSDMAQMNMVSSSLEEPSIAPSALMNDFSVQSSFSTDLTMGNPENVAHTVLSSPSTTTGSNSASHTSSPSLNGVPQTFHIGSSSLASALDNNTLPRSRSGSAGSPSLLTTAAASDLGAFTSGSGPPSSAASLGFPPRNDQTFAGSKESSPEAPADAHLMVLGDMLKK